MSSLLELARRLHQERLFVRSEQETIHRLNIQIQQRSEQLSHVFWTTRQHHLNLNHFVTNSSQGTPVTCSQRATQLDNVKFVDAYKELGYQESMYGDFLQAFRSNPTLAAACLAYGEKLSLESTTRVVQSVVLGVYGNSIVSGDHRHLLELIETLLLLQLAGEDQPRRILHKGNAAICTVYRLFTESLLLGKLFLTSALHKPIMQVLMDDELYLERDSNKILDCFSQTEIEKRFGKKGDPEFESRIKEHLARTEERLYQICQSFIDSLQSAMFCFPQSMGWVIARAYNIVKEAGLVSHSEARALCADLLLQMFICPAIVNPELYGVTGDAPISEFTRFNLMQIAQVLQVLALWDGSTQSENSLYERFDKTHVSSILDSVINTWHTDGVPTSPTPDHGYVDTAVFLTCTQLADLIQYLRDIQQADVRGVDQSSLAEILSHLPENHPPAIAEVLSRRESATSLNSSLGEIPVSEDGMLTPGDQPRNGSVGSGSGSGSGQPSPSVGRSWKFEGSSSNTTTPQSKKLFSKSIRSPKGKSFKRSESSTAKGAEASSEAARPSTAKSGSGSGDSLPGDSRASTASDVPDVVLVISLNGTSGSGADPPGLLTENEVLELDPAGGMENAETNSESDVLAPPDSGTLNDGDSERMDKRLRFSLYSTDFSELGEGGMEAMSSTSGSSMEDIDPTESVPADDTSSFRGTSSHGNQDEEDEMEEGDLESIPHTNNDEALKALERKLPTSRESIEDKMRKFEIRSQLGVRFGGAVVAGLGSEEGDRVGEGGHGSSHAHYLDTRSDTWSTDAYASDSEPQAEQEDPPAQADGRLQEIAENPDQVPGQIRTGNAGPYLALLPRDEDSRSDVWSVEVLPSDSEPPDVKPEDRLQELESESTAGAEDAIDQLEENRSRASTPGLSAASGVSGTSGLSLVSDNIHAKGGEEQGSSSERSFGKTPSSISPDADDMIGPHRGAGSGPNSSRYSAAGSSHSSGSGDSMAAVSSSRPQTAPTTSSSALGLLMESQIQSVSVAGQESDPVRKLAGINGAIRRSKSASPAYLGRVGSLDLKKQSSGLETVRSEAEAKQQSKQKMLSEQGAAERYTDTYLSSSAANSPLAGARPEAASTPDDGGSTLQDTIMNSGYHANTIKRSPYKHSDSFSRDRVSAFNSVPSSLARDIAAEASNLDGATSVASSQMTYYNIDAEAGRGAPPSVDSGLASYASSTAEGKLEKNSGVVVNHVKMNGGVPNPLRDPPTASTAATSTFVPITSASTYSPSPPYHDLSAFDPYSSSSATVSSSSNMLQSKPVATGNSLLNMNSMSAAFVDLSLGSPSQPPQVSRGVDQQSQVPSPVPHGTGAKSKHGHSKHISGDADYARGVERKKSWWKSPRIPVLSTKRKNYKSSHSQGSLEDSNGPRHLEESGGYMKMDASSGQHRNNGTEASLPKPLEPSRATSNTTEPPGEDIMQKYMRKAASNHSPKLPHTGGATGQSASQGTPSGNAPMPSAGDGKSKQDLDETLPLEKTGDSQTLNSSSTTDTQSTPSNISAAASDRTVTTVTQGTSPEYSLSSPRKSDTTTCRSEYRPSPAQLLTDAQRKLRLMLATTESLPESARFSGLGSNVLAEPFGGFPGIAFQSGSSQKRPSQEEREHGRRVADNARDEIISFLRIQLAEAVGLQDHSRVAQIHETTRCIVALDNEGCKTLLLNLWRGYKLRSSYIAYLVRTKQALLTTSSYLQHLFHCTERDQDTCRRYLTSVCVGLFLKRMDNALRSFKSQFTQATAADEKVALVRRFLSWLYGQMSQDAVWESSGEEQLQEAERAIERSVFVYIYKLALYPNGDGDVLRDQLFYKHISRLAAVVTSQHSSLLIPAKYLNECPWPSAQAEARSVNAYKTPRDKLAAVLRCCNTIMNLLKLADEGTVPGADDFTPVLVYVLIMANPPNLLSTVQYITNFIGDELTGEDSYWWMQFTAATEFIKTIDERK